MVKKMPRNHPFFLSIAQQKAWEKGFSGKGKCPYPRNSNLAVIWRNARIVKQNKWY